MTFLRKTAIALVGLLIGAGLVISETFRLVVLSVTALACVWALGLFIFLRLCDRMDDSAQAEKEKEDEEDDEDADAKTTDN